MCDASHGSDGIRDGALPLAGGVQVDKGSAGLVNTSASSSAAVKRARCRVKSGTMRLGKATVVKIFAGANV